jgi:hypothetical protein
MRDDKYIRLDDDPYPSWVIVEKTDNESKVTNATKIDKDKDHL